MFGCGVTLGVTIMKVPPLLLVFDPCSHLSSTTGWVQIPCRMRVQIPVLTTSFPRHAHCFSFWLDCAICAVPRQINPRNPLCCLGCQLMSNRFAHRRWDSFWMNCAIWCRMEINRCHPDERGSLAGLPCCWPWWGVASCRGCHCFSDNLERPAELSALMGWGWVVAGSAMSQPLWFSVEPRSGNAVSSGSYAGLTAEVAASSGDGVAVYCQFGCLLSWLRLPGHVTDQLNRDMIGYHRDPGIAMHFGQVPSPFCRERLACRFWGMSRGSDSHQLHHQPCRATQSGYLDPVYLLPVSPLAVQQVAG